MSATTLLSLIAAAVIALGLSVYMYGFKSRLNLRLRWILGILRFMTLLTLGVLLVNPKIKKETYTTQKPALNILVDNSSSLQNLNRDSVVVDLSTALLEDAELNERFDISAFQFDQSFSPLNSLDFQGVSSNIAEGLQGLTTINGDQNAATVLLTDGNQTLGRDYASLGNRLKNPVFPVVIGDTTQFEDLRISRLNANRYAYQDNEFPVELSLGYTGNNAVNTVLIIRKGNQVVKRQALSFDPQGNAQTIEVLLKADQVGIQTYTAELQALASERNTSNNRQQFAVEVIDQSTRVAIISSIQHPDLGALKKSITTLKQREVSVMEPAQAVGKLDDYQLVILYQPDSRFTPVYQELNELKKNRWTITGLQTDWNFLNDIQLRYAKIGAGGEDQVSAETNRNYPIFAMDPVDFSSYPPLITQFGSLDVFVPYDELLSQTISGIFTESPMLFSFEADGVREAVWDAQGLWRWRAHNFIETRSFEQFDDLVANMVQYLSSNKRRSRLNVSYESFYYSNAQIGIQAQYFNENYQFDPEASLNLTYTNADGQSQRLPMLLKNNYYQANLDGLAAGMYDFTVTVDGQGIARSGQFTILDFSVEDQLLTPDVLKLSSLASNTAGSLFYEDQLGQLKSALMEDSRFVAIQKSRQNVVPLISLKILLGLLGLLLAIEWFTRKYNGLI
ncbi:VWA domain-containing protein [Gilvibacter sediminis]|uniref:VWA domain-containing protein n=1 Tax=Gilvibacter sediminis TaxID=379071 RepID=UPI0023508BA5|nr:VWA domain-containing protein [Gilvibacter sediminis]MDC7998277.1 VWA domain-containing protein [Gilvibacter sediminis]